MRFLASRMKWLLCTVFLLSPGMLRAANDASGAGSPLVFVTVADLHVTDAQSMEGFKQAIDQINNVIKPAFVYVAGDTPDGGTAEQYRLYKAVRDTIKCPVYDVAGDHEAKAGGMEHYRETLGEPTYTFEVGKYRFIALNSMGLDQAQLDWAKTELATAKAKNQTPIAFIHHNLAGLKDKAMVSQLDKVLNDGAVKLVLAGHTHSNTVINSGSRLDITTTSIRTPKGKDGAGYAIVTLDEDRIAWHFVPLGQKTAVAVSSPVSKLMATGAEAVVKGKVPVRVKAYDVQGITSVVATVAGGAPIPLKQDASGTWGGELDSTALKDGEQPLKVTATTAGGQTASEEIIMLVSQSGAFAAAPQTISDAGPGGKRPGKEGEKKGPGPKGGPKKEPVTMDQVPAPVRDAIRKAAGANELTKLEKEEKEGQQTYKADWDVKEQKHELRVATDGTILETKQDISPSDLPDPFAAAAKKAVGDLKEAECKKIVQIRDGKPQERYEVRTDVNGERKHLVISPNGSVEFKGPGAPKGGPKEKPKKD